MSPNHFVPSKWTPILLVWNMQLVTTVWVLSSTFYMIIWLFFLPIIQWNVTIPRFTCLVTSLPSTARHMRQALVFMAFKVRVNPGVPSCLMSLLRAVSKTELALSIGITAFAVSSRRLSNLEQIYKIVCEISWCQGTKVQAAKLVGTWA